MRVYHDTIHRQNMAIGGVSNQRRTKKRQAIQNESEKRKGGIQVVQRMASSTCPTLQSGSSLPSTSEEEVNQSSIRERCLNSSPFFSTICQLIHLKALLLFS